MVADLNKCRKICTDLNYYYLIIFAKSKFYRNCFPACALDSYVLINAFIGS